MQVSCAACSGRRRSVVPCAGQMPSRSSRCVYPPALAHSSSFAAAANSYADMSVQIFAPMAPNAHATYPPDQAASTILASEGGIALQVRDASASATPSMRYVGSALIPAGAYDLIQAPAGLYMCEFTRTHQPSTVCQDVRALWNWPASCSFFTCSLSLSLSLSFCLSFLGLTAAQVKTAMMEALEQQRGTYNVIELSSMTETMTKRVLQQVDLGDFLQMAGSELLSSAEQRAHPADVDPLDWPSADEAADTPAAVAHVITVLQQLQVPLDADGGFIILDTHTRQHLLDVDVPVAGLSLRGGTDAVIVPFRTADDTPYLVQQLRVVFEFQLPAGQIIGASQVEPVPAASEFSYSASLYARFLDLSIRWRIAKLASDRRAAGCVYALAPSRARRIDGFTEQLQPLLDCAGGHAPWRLCCCSYCCCCCCCCCTRWCSRHRHRQRCVARAGMEVHQEVASHELGHEPHVPPRQGHA